MTAADGHRHGRQKGFVLVTVLWLTLLVWGLLAGLLTMALLQHRLAVAAQRSAAAAVAAEQAVASGLVLARAQHAAEGAWPSSLSLGDLGRCELSVAEVVAEDAWWRLAVDGRFEGLVVRREGTTHLP